MLFRFLALVLIFNACSGANTDASDKQGSEAKPSFTFNKISDVTDRVQVVLSSTPYPLQEQQKPAIESLTAAYTFDYLNASRLNQSELRMKIMEQVLTPQQTQAWVSRSKKRKQSITIE